MDQKRERLLTGILSVIGILAWILIAAQLVAYIQKGERAQGAVADAMERTPEASSEIFTAPSQTSTPSLLPTSTPMAAPSFTPTSAPTEPEEDGWVTVAAQELRVRAQANLDCEVYEVATQGRQFVWVEALSTSEWIAIQYTDDQIAYVAAQHVTVEKNEQRPESAEPETSPTLTPTGTPTPTPKPTSTPTPKPTSTPTPKPTSTPTPKPTGTPTPKPTSTPTLEPTSTPTPSTTVPKVPEDASDEDLLTALIYTESGDDFEEMKGVACVVINRMKQTNDSMYDVLYAPGQFTVAAKGTLANAYARWVGKAYSDSTEWRWERANEAAKYVLANGSGDFDYLFFRLYKDDYADYYEKYVVIGSTLFHNGIRK